MWDFLVAALELLGTITGPDTDALKSHTRAELLPEYRAFKQAQRNTVGFDSPHQQTRRPATPRRTSKRTRPPAIPPHA